MRATGSDEFVNESWTAYNNSRISSNLGLILLHWPRVRRKAQVEDLEIGFRAYYWTTDYIGMIGNTKREYPPYCDDSLAPGPILRKMLMRPLEKLVFHTAAVAPW